MLELEASVGFSSGFSDPCRSLTDHVLCDACYLELAERKGSPVARLDTELRKAATKVGVELVEAR